MQQNEIVDKVLELFKSGDTSNTALAKQLIIGTTGIKNIKRAEEAFWATVANLQQLAIYLELLHMAEGLSVVFFFINRLEERHFIYHTITNHEITCINGNYIEAMRDFLLLKDVEDCLKPKTVRFMTFSTHKKTKLLSFRGNKLDAQIPVISGTEIYLFK